MRSKIIIGCKTWAKKGKGFWQSFLILLLVLSNDTQHLFLYEKNMNI
jgi:hypothetical protein